MSLRVLVDRRCAELGLLRKDLAGRMEISEGRLSQIVNGKKGKIRPETVHRLAGAILVRPEEILRAGGENGKDG